MTIEFSGAVWCWRGPAPFHFLSVPEAPSQELHEIAPLVSYGWGMIPVQAQIGATRFTTSLFRKDGVYVLPLKDRVRSAEGVEEGTLVTARIDVHVPA